LNQYPGLIEFAQGTEEYTLFAPSNAAFASINGPSGARPPNFVMHGLLLFHFVKGKKMKVDLTEGTVLNSEFIHPWFPGFTQTIEVNADGTLQSWGGPNYSVDIVVGDGLATNGVVHVVESILVPRTMSGTVEPIPPILSFVFLNNNFTNLAKVVRAADDGFIENPAAGVFKISTWLSMTITTKVLPTSNLSGVTFFAVPNVSGNIPIFTEEAANVLIARPDKGRSFLLNHIIAPTNSEVGQYIFGDPPATYPLPTTKLASGQTINPLTGSAKRIFVNVGPSSAASPFGVELSNDLSSTPPPAATFRPILEKNIQMRNGQIHVIGGPLN